MPTLFYACSGAANTGLLADRVTRQLAKNCNGNMTCLAGLGAGLEKFVNLAGGPVRNVVLDGCPLGCGAKIMEKAGAEFTQLVMTDFGVEKGKTEITDEVVSAVREKILAAIAE